ncbi:CDP-alcohol phosphatidyltransferase [Micromonospora terminaliae]|uniref:CDP-alcohol phosphatidyltransferase n=1 Tax=Micromonospora terminaliae TaxID=1914461 RepID=A0AAJ2ZHJ1_9ACTN|nr:CDP-alcohol phosphatidyltransferase family protein [Micromonospora terminaliae]NES29826.1 CDP-alcohol phosphatidyltransferase family protein [Micromonospora terminaliae]QGL49990.1 CDP-alcohol phosphatidyltransferase [Micromonospora terminaliae]
MHSATLAEPSRPSVADFHRVNRGGGLFSESISQWIGAVFALVAQRLGLRPTALTITNLVLGLAASVTVVALADDVAAGSVPAWAVGLVALVGWQIAYALDCADGQLARVTGQGSAAGARVDVLCDVAAQIALVTALGATAVAQRPATPVWLIAVFAGTWMVNLVTSVMQAGPNAASMVTSTSLPVRLAKLVRDYGAVIFLAGLVLAVAPALTVWVIVAFTVVNGGFLLASIAFSARASLR